MLVIAGGVLLALMAFAVLRRVFVPLVMIVLGLWLWTGHAHSQSFTHEEQNVLWEQQMEPLLQELEVAVMAGRCGVLGEPNMAGAVTKIRIDETVARFGVFQSRYKEIVSRVKSADAMKPTADQCREMRADPRRTLAIKQWDAQSRP